MTTMALCKCDWPGCGATEEMSPRMTSPSAWGSVRFSPPLEHDESGLLIDPGSLDLTYCPEHAEAARIALGLPKATRTP